MAAPGGVAVFFFSATKYDISDTRYVRDDL